MSGDEWFRRKTWSDRDQQEFFARLARSRTAFHKAQYLRLQAYELSEVGDPHLLEVALELVGRHLAEFDSPFERVQIHHLAATCCDRLGRLDDAIYHFRSALEARRAAPNLDCGTELTFAWFIVQRELTKLYDEALRNLERAHVAFPIQAFKAAAARALIASSRGEDLTAATFASEALGAASLTESEFRYHRSLGLVGPEHKSLMAKLRGMTAA